MLGAGSVGVKEGQKLRMGNCDGQTAANMGEAGRKALGITQRMSLTWEESRKAFGADEVVRSVLGNEMVDTYLAVNEASALCSLLRSSVDVLCSIWLNKWTLALTRALCFAWLKTIENQRSRVVIKVVLSVPEMCRLVTQSICVNASGKLNFS